MIKCSLIYPPRRNAPSVANKRKRAQDTMFFMHYVTNDDEQLHA